MLFARLVSWAWVPPDWGQGVQEGWILLSNNNPAMSSDVKLPSVGNGFISTIVGSPDVFMAGVFNSRDAPEKSHRARLPSAHQLTVAPEYAWPSATKAAWAIDTRHGVWLERHDSLEVSIERRFYAHQVRRGLLVSEYDIRATGPLNLTIDAGQTKDPWLASVDFAFGPIEMVAAASNGFTACTHAAESGSPAWKESHPWAGCTNVSMVYSIPPVCVPLPAGLSHLRFVSAHASNLSDAEPWSIAVAAHASAVAAGVELFDSHAEAWTSLYDSRNGGGVVQVHVKWVGFEPTWPQPYKLEPPQLSVPH